jgi:two-component system NtrC family response regulator
MALHWFLDEVAEMDYQLQPKILRFLQEFTFERVGGSDKINVDVRIIAATNRDLKQAIQNQQLREDLYYRLNVVNIAIPPLRKHLDDMPDLSALFLQRFIKEYNKSFDSFTDDAMDALCAYSWPGNIRELENVIQQTVLFHDGRVVEFNMLPDHIKSNFKNLADKFRHRIQSVDFKMKMPSFHLK